MSSTRIDYVDWLKGLSIILVVWFHTSVHPEWLNVPFRLPIFFMASGIFFKVVSFRQYISKKYYQLFIPFIFFYLLGYFYHFLVYSFSPTHAGEQFPAQMIFDLFGGHVEDLCYQVNAPLWFISALINMQLMLMVFVKTLRKWWLIVGVSVLLGIIGNNWLFYTHTYFMFGRALMFLPYYAVGHLFGKKIIGFIEESGRQRMRVGGVFLVMFAAGVVIYNITASYTLQYLSSLIWNMGLTGMLLLLFRRISRIHRLNFFGFFGRNSYMVLGTHYLLLNIVVLYMEWNLYEGSIFFWMLIVALIMIISVPMIRYCNRHIPFLIGKEPLFSTISLRRA